MPAKSKTEKYRVEPYESKKYNRKDLIAFFNRVYQIDGSLPYINVKDNYLINKAIDALDHGISYIAIIKSEIIGIITLFPSPKPGDPVIASKADVSRISEIYIQPDYDLLSIKKDLFEKALRYARYIGKKRIVVCLSKATEEHLKHYHKLGFVVEKNTLFSPLNKSLEMSFELQIKKQLKLTKPQALETKAKQSLDPIKQ
ncbi:GNAT family N-acetyltransferase [Pedobacter aquatilis]|uniref:GNAT family N-acetyltransferase n=1 Tax=Pedobacter aquatilis TaxID=351343 RepID=UPI00292F61BD|nr:GNAT family N-acetyltransferase [Pedobacter aquatilis]